MESEMIGDGQGCVDEVDKAYHDSLALRFVDCHSKCQGNWELALSQSEVKFSVL